MGVRLPILLNAVLGCNALEATELLERTWGGVLAADLLELTCDGALPV